MTGYTEKVAVIGAGISGLACAYRLKRHGLKPLVLEATERAGGVIATVRRNGFLFETGPQFPRFPEAVWSLIRELHLESEFEAGDSKAKRYILKDGRLHLAPLSLGEFFSTPLVPYGAKLRLATEGFRRSSPPPGEETLAEFVQRKFGKEFLDYLVDPFISTIFFGDAEKMEMASAFPMLVEWERDSGSVMRGALRAHRSKQNGKNSGNAAEQANSELSANGTRVTDALPALGSFKSGMAALPERLAEELKGGIRYAQRIECISPAPNGDGSPMSGWEIRFEDGEQIKAESLVLAVPAYAAAKLLEKSVPQLASLLSAIEYAPVCAVSSAYDRSRVSHPLDGFGFMTPRREGLQTICTFWNSSLFPGHAPNGKVLLTSFAGREASDAPMIAAEESCAQTVEAENAKILGISGRSLDRVVWRSPRALPQYNLGHAHRVSQITDALCALPNLYLAGNYLTGRSIGDCVQIASQVAENVNSHLRK